MYSLPYHLLAWKKQAIRDKVFSFLINKDEKILLQTASRICLQSVPPVFLGELSKNKFIL